MGSPLGTVCEGCGLYYWGYRVEDCDREPDRVLGQIIYSDRVGEMSWSFGLCNRRQKHKLEVCRPATPRTPPGHIHEGTRQTAQQMRTVLNSPLANDPFQNDIPVTERSNPT